MRYLRPACAVALVTALAVGGASVANGMTTQPAPASHMSTPGKKKPKKKRKAAKKPVLRGAIGPRGPQGIAGSDGAAGAAGASGDAGASGAAGAAGVAGTAGTAGAAGTTAVTRLDTGSATDSSVTGGAYEQLRAVGSFIKASAPSRVKLTWNGHIRGTGLIATDWLCDFQLRVDGAQPPSNGGRAVLYAGGGIQNDAPAGDATFFNGLSAGSHAVTIWVRGSATTLTCEMNHGDLPDELFVEEMPS